MVARALLLTVCVQALCLSACSESSFSGNNTAPAKKKSTSADSVAEKKERVDPKVETDSDNDEDLDNDVKELEDGVVTVTDLDIKKQEGRSVEACFSYNQEKMNALIANGQAIHGHFCNEAVFDVYFSGQRAGQINLNNRNGSGMGSSPFISGGLSGPSVHGGTFAGKWVNGVFDVETRCALMGGCHDDVGFLSLIGEVVTASGKKKWLKIDQGMIYPGRHYNYKFEEFTLSDVKPTFGPFCELQ